MTDHRFSARKKMEGHGWGRTEKSFYSGLTILLNHTLSLYMSLYQSFQMCNALGAAVEKDTYVSANAI